MKEIIRKIVLAVVVVAIAIGVTVKFIKGDEPAVDATTTTAAVSDGAQSDSNASENASPDNSKDKADKNEASNAATNNKGDSTQQKPSSSSGDSAAQDATNANPDSQDSSAQKVTDANGNTVQSSPQADGNTQSNNGTTQQNAKPQGDAQQSVNKIDAYQQIFASGRFIMKIHDPDLGPVTMAMSGNKMLVDASMEGVSLKMLYDGDTPDKDNPETGSWYVIIDQLKKYSPMPADLIGDMNVDEITKDFAKEEIGREYTKSEERIAGVAYYCESYVDENGNTTKYYFSGDKLIRSDSVSPSGAVSTTVFQEISGDVDESIFKIPDGYAKFDISWLLGMIG